MMWFCWVPVARADVAAKNGATFIPFWEGQIMAFVATRLLATVFLSPICLAIVPRQKWEPMLAGTLIGLAASILDRYSFNRINLHAGFLAALLVIPLIAGIVVILPLHLAIRRSQLGSERPAALA
jgi:hypothetical protein